MHLSHRRRLGLARHRRGQRLPLRSPREAGEEGRVSRSLVAQEGRKRLGEAAVIVVGSITSVDCSGRGSGNDGRGRRCCACRVPRRFFLLVVVFCVPRRQALPHLPRGHLGHGRGAVRCRRHLQEGAAGPARRLALPAALRRRGRRRREFFSSGLLLSSVLESPPPLGAREAGGRPGPRGLAGQARAELRGPRGGRARDESPARRASSETDPVLVGGDDDEEGGRRGPRGPLFPAEGALPRVDLSARGGDRVRVAGRPGASGESSLCFFFRPRFSAVK